MPIFKKERIREMMMKKRTWLILFIAVFSVGLSQTAKAQQELTQNTVKIEEMIVTATKTEKMVEDVPGSVTIISQNDLKKQNIQTVDDALNSLSGVYVKRTKGLMESTPSLRMRGFNGDQYTLVLLDGLPLNDAYGGGIEWGSLSVGNIERIEVVRGAASALYGGNAMGGVINIITKTPEKLELEAISGYGTHDAYRYRFAFGNKLLDRLSFRLGYEKEGTDGYETTPVVRSISAGNGNVSGGYPMNDSSGNPTRWVAGDKGDNGAQRHAFDGKLSFDFSDTGYLSFTAVSGRHEYDYGPPSTYMGIFGDSTTYAVAGTGQRARFQPNDFISYTGIGKNETDTYSLAFQEIFGPMQIKGQLGTVQVDDRYTLEAGSGSADYSDSTGTMKITENESWFAELSGDIPMGDSHLLTMGASYRKDSSDTDDYDIPFYRSYSGAGPSTFYSGGDSKTWAVFAQDEWQIMDPLTIYLGLRFDSWEVYNGASGVPGGEQKYESNTESELSPKIAAVWKPFGEDTTFRASAGHAFRPPTLYELYRSWQSGSTAVQSNPNLKPETVWAYELGYDQYLFERKTRLSVTGFRNDIEDLIYFQTAPGTRTRINVGEARTYGLELEASQKITDWLSLWGNFTYTDAEIRKNPTDPASEGKNVTGIPETAWNLGVDTQYKWFKGSLVGRYYSKIYSNSENKDTEEGVYGTYEPAFLLDAKVTLTPLNWMELSLSMNNILDEDYYQYYKYDGRTVFAELALRF
jgi:iron complex outermembrane receptor protein